MVSNPIDTEVLIVGAGPVGLFLANECARRNLRWRLIEERSSQSEHSKALASFPRTLEIFDMAGIVAPFLEQANRVTKVAVMIRDRTLAHMKFEPPESPYSFVAMVPQDVTERLLVEELRRKGGNVEYDTKFIAAEQDDYGVNVTIERRGESTEVRAAVVVGCDGAHSTVRHQLNLPFEGAEYQASFLLADVDTNTRLPADEMQLCPSEYGPVAIFPMSATRRRIVATAENVEGDAPPLDLVRKILAQRAPSAIEADGLHWSSYFRIHHRQVARLVLLHQVRRLGDRPVFIDPDHGAAHDLFDRDEIDGIATLSGPDHLANNVRLGHDPHNPPILLDKHASDLPLAHDLRRIHNRSPFLHTNQILLHELPCLHHDDPSLD